MKELLMDIAGPGPKRPALMKTWRKISMCSLQYAENWTEDSAKRSNYFCENLLELEQIKHRYNVNEEQNHLFVPLLFLNKLFFCTTIQIWLTVDKLMGQEKLCRESISSLSVLLKYILMWYNICMFYWKNAHFQRRYKTRDCNHKLVR